MNDVINFENFIKVDVRVGTIVKVYEFPKARNPAYKLHIDFGILGIKKTSAQITVVYKKEMLIGKQVLAVVNFKKKQVADFMSECLILGAVDGDKVFLLHPEQKVKNGSAIS